MASFNRVILAGNLTRDPQLTYTASNTPVCKFGLATNRKWKDKVSGEMREEVCFVDCTAFGRGGEVINQYMKKGRSLLVEGRLNFSQWEGQDGSKRSKLDVVVENFQFLGEGGGGSREPGQTQPARSAAARPAPAAEPGPTYTEDYGGPADDDNVPF